MKERGRSLGRKLRSLVPQRPGRRYSIFDGTTTFGDWLTAVWLLLSRNINADERAIARYESAFAEATGTTHAISFGAGRMALFALLEALGVGEGDEVIIPAFTCVVVPNAIIYHGARPVYVDIDPLTFNIDVGKIEKAVTTRTKVIYAQHTFGLPCDVRGIRVIAAKHGLSVIEDGALALGSRVDGAPVGSLGHAAFFSTDRSKTISTHLGGVATTNDPEIGAKLRSIQQRSPFLSGSLVRKILFTFASEHILFAPTVFWLGRSIHVVMTKLGMFFYFCDELSTTKPADYPYPCRLSPAQALLGSRQLRRFEANRGHRHAAVAELERRIARFSNLRRELHESVMLRYSFLVRDRAAFERRLSERFDLGVWFTSVVHGRQDALEKVGYSVGSCPIAENAARHIVNFPTHPRIPVTALARVVDDNWHWMEREIVREDYLDGWAAS